MENSKFDRRIKYTKKALRQSLLTLMEQKDIQKITVKELCELADINRGTFYAHYYDPQDLLQQIEDELYSQLENALTQITERPIDSRIAIPSSLFKETFECFADNRDVCRILFGEHGDTKFLDRIASIEKTRYLKEWQTISGIQDPIQIEYLNSFVLSGCIGILRCWAKNGMRESAEQMASIAERVIMSGLATSTMEKQMGKYVLKTNAVK